MDWITEIAENLMGYRRIIGLSDLVDILIMAYLLYRLMLLARKTRSGQVVKGVLLILLVVWLSGQFHLRVLSTALNQMVELGLLLLVILFTPEIRRFLEQMGSSGKLSGVFARSDTFDELDNAIHQTVQAYAQLSKDKVGALMVFERNIILEDSIKSGTVLDARVSSELLKNIFWNKAPMHDGAVIVRNGRIAAAGCMLPLSGNVNLSRDLGMRHRAGIGMSEHSDAVIAIVSEETGSISVAVGGMLKRHLAPETLDRLLRKELMPEEADEKGNFHKVKELTLNGLFKKKKGASSDDK
ncbi:MAG: TIGR00159 family protein [Oscillospiraceae bacterium]|nr:TIGR00159 family protein [Oscillospiraceae bacterium]